LSDKKIEDFLADHAKNYKDPIPLYNLSKHYREIGDHGKGYSYAKKCLELIKETPTVAEFLVEFELSVCAYYLGLYEDAIALSDKILFNPQVENWLKELTLFNRDFSIQKIKESDSRSDLSSWEGASNGLKIFIGDWWPNHTKVWLANLMVYLRMRGCGVSSNRDFADEDKLSKMAEDSDCVIIWNAIDDYYSPIKNMCKEKGIPFFVTEVGYFPQSQYYTIDSKGINATSQLMDDDLSWVEDKHIKRMEERRNSLLQGKVRDDKGYIFVPLQLPNDTNIRHNSPYKDMQSFIDHVEEKFDGEEIIIKRHPYDELEYKSKSGVVTEGSSIDYILGAKSVYGINSTVLLEAAILGVPVEAIGEGFLKRHKGNHEKLLAALVDREIPINSIDLDYWLDPVIQKTLECKSKREANDK
jgi:hypothetical protein